MTSPSGVPQDPVEQAIEKAIRRIGWGTDHSREHDCGYILRHLVEQVRELDADRLREDQEARDDV